MCYFFPEPAQQPPPLHNQLSNTALHLYWTEPDYPNGVIGRYRVYRNGTLVFTGNETGKILYNREYQCEGYRSFAYF